ncbi:FecR family protein [Inquilinus sp. NPDC058860]|uniref:FecR family protein n=1 Tax=Inquilinus sp. NPDC058860 TaxID=3346652 RepID=UPI00368F8D81
MDLQPDARDQALRWFVRINAGDASAADRAAFEAWLAADPAHGREIDTLAGLWADLGRIPDPRPSALPRTPLFGRRRVLAGGLAFAGLGGAVALTGLPPALTSDIRTGTGELRTVTLADGTRVDLDAGSALSLAFSDSAREVSLDRGRALFTVAKDAARPFRVSAGPGRSTALGTQFVVHRWADEVTVAVMESAVVVAVPGTGGAAEARVAAGKQVSYGPAGLGAVRKADGQVETAWRRGKLVFEDRSLRQVVAELGRYRSGSIAMTDGTLAELRVSGIFDVSDPDAALDAITRTLPVRVVSLTRYLVVLRPA